MHEERVPLGDRARSEVQDTELELSLLEVRDPLYGLLTSVKSRARVELTELRCRLLLRVRRAESRLDSLREGGRLLLLMSEHRRLLR